NVAAFCAAPPSTRRISNVRIGRDSSVYPTYQFGCRLPVVPDRHQHYQAQWQVLTHGAVPGRIEKRCAEPFNWRSAVRSDRKPLHFIREISYQFPPWSFVVRGGSELALSLDLRLAAIP